MHLLIHSFIPAFTHSLLSKCFSVSHSIIHSFKVTSGSQLFHFVIRAFPHSLVRSFSVIYSFTHSGSNLFHSIIRSSTKSMFPHSSLHSFIHSFTHSRIYSFTHALSHLFIPSPIHFIPSPIYSFIH